MSSAAAALHLQALDGRVERVNLETHYCWKGFAETSEKQKSQSLHSSHFYL